MKISTKGRYALRLMIDLAQHDAGGYIPLRDISKRQQISAKYLEQIVVQLSRAGFVISTRGAQGGYQLARHPSEYTVGDILRITEGSLAPVACLEHEPVGSYARVDECITLSFWRGLYDAINNYVDSVTLEDLVNNGTLNFSISNAKRQTIFRLSFFRSIRLSNGALSLQSERCGLIFCPAGNVPCAGACAESAACLAVR